MKKNFPYIVDRIIREEVRPGHEQDGDLHTDPNDPGGTTKFGFAQRYNQDLDVATLTRPQAERRYYEQYWEPIGGNELPTGADLVSFNFAVNAGVNRAIVFAREAKRYASENSIEGSQVLWIELFIDQYTRLVEEFYNTRPDKLKKLYLKDWLKRTARIAKYARLMLMSELTGKSIEELLKMKVVPDVR